VWEKLWAFCVSSGHCKLNVAGVYLWSEGSLISWFSISTNIREVYNQRSVHSVYSAVVNRGFLQIRTSASSIFMYKSELASWIEFYENWAVIVDRCRSEIADRLHQLHDASCEHSNITAHLQQVSSMLDDVGTNCQQLSALIGPSRQDAADAIELSRVCVTINKDHRSSKCAL